MEHVFHFLISFIFRSSSSSSYSTLVFMFFLYSFGTKWFVSPVFPDSPSGRRIDSVYCNVHQNGCFIVREFLLKLNQNNNGIRIFAMKSNLNTKDSKYIAAHWQSWGVSEIYYYERKKKIPEITNLRTAHYVIDICRQSTNKKCEQSDRSTGAFIDCCENWSLKCKKAITILFNVWLRFGRE